mmetsp:Transcript_99124/g.171901  ORF Transcript_99124/g.171901 Transcript_99124/m.171901 type:complete len:567 (-) Transcript_99124:108-1808(-)
MQTRSARWGNSPWVRAFLVFVALPMVIAVPVDDDDDDMEEEAPSHHGVSPWNLMTPEEAMEHMTWDDEAIEKRREWLLNYRTVMANSVAHRLRLGKNNVFGGYELTIDMDQEPEKKSGKAKEPLRWRHRCLDANFTYDKVDTCASRVLTALGSICSVQANKITASAFLKKTIRDHIKVLNSGMVYELGMLRRRMPNGPTVWGFSPSVLSDFMQMEAAAKGKTPVVEAPQFSIHLNIQAAIMYIYFACAGPLGVDSMWESGEELWKGIQFYYNEKTWSKIGQPQEQAYNFVRLLGQSLWVTKGQSEMHFEIQKYMEGFEEFVWGYWQQWMEKGSETQYNGCEGLANGIAWHLIGVGGFPKKELFRTQKWFEDMIAKNFNSIMPPAEDIKEKGMPTMMIQSCGITLFQSAWAKLTKDPGMTIQFFRDAKRSIEMLEITAERYKMYEEGVEKMPSADAMIGMLTQMPQVMHQMGRFSYRIDDTTDCLDALATAEKILDDPPDNLPLKPSLEGIPLADPNKGKKGKKSKKPPKSKQVPQMDLDDLNMKKKDDDDGPSLSDLDLEPAHVEL